ncbi:MAG: hypothetical protein H6R14_790 [Proteobacteria bacterium]|nr:hypothetical protein [Pseudomonadota bacterium]
MISTKKMASHPANGMSRPNERYYRRQPERDHHADSSKFGGFSALTGEVPRKYAQSTSDRTSSQVTTELECFSISMHRDSPSFWPLDKALRK